MRKEINIKELGFNIKEYITNNDLKSCESTSMRGDIWNYEPSCQFIFAKNFCPNNKSSRRDISENVVVQTHQPELLRHKHVCSSWVCYRKEVISGRNVAGKEYAKYYFRKIGVNPQICLKLRTPLQQLKDSLMNWYSCLLV